MVAIIEAWRAGLLKRGNWMRNIGAGLVVGVVAMPLAMAFAIASGAKPENGLYTALVAGLVVTLFGGTRVQIAGPTGAFVVVLAGITAKYGMPGLQIVTIMAGAMLLAFGLARMGGVIKFIPESVILGFTAGIAVVIFVGQWESFFGLPKVVGEHFHERLLGLLVALSPLAYNVPLAALAAILFVVAFNMSQIGHLVRTARRAPRSDVAVMFITLGLTVFTDLVLAVEVGVILAMLNFMRRMSSTVEVREMVDGELAAHATAGEEVDVPPGVLVYTVEGPFFFGAVDQFEGALLHTHTAPRALVISLARVPFIDLTGLQALDEVTAKLGRRGIAMALCGANTAVAERLERSGMLDRLTTAPTSTLADAVDSVRVPHAH